MISIEQFILQDQIIEYCKLKNYCENQLKYI